MTNKPSPMEGPNEWAAGFALHLYCDHTNTKLADALRALLEFAKMYGPEPGPHAGRADWSQYFNDTHAALAAAGVMGYYTEQPGLMK